MNLISSSVTADQLRASPELFYLLRDGRMNMGVSVSPNLVPVSVTISDYSAHTPNGQMVLFTLLNTLLRTGRRFSGPVVHIPDAPLAIRVGGLGSSTLRAATSELASKVDPHNKLAFGESDFGLTVVIGDKTCSADRIIATGVSGRGAKLSSVPFESVDMPHPVAAVVAANTAAAEIYKHFSPFVRAEACKEFERLIPALGRISIGSTLLVGAGGISHSLVWVLQWLDWTGQLMIIDFDLIELSNLNRYFCAFIDDIGANKPQLLSEFLQTRVAIKAQHQNGTYEQLRDSKSLDPTSYSSIVTAVDNVSTRLEVQSDLPRLVFNAGTNSWSFQASRHSLRGGACLACLFPPLAGVNHGRRVRCDERLDGKEQPSTESYSFVTGTAGAFLALQVAAGFDPDLLELPAQHHGSGLNLDWVIAENRQKDSQCTLFCNEPCVLERFEQKYAAQKSAATH